MAESDSFTVRHFNVQLISTAGTSDLWNINLELSQHGSPLLWFGVPLLLLWKTHLKLWLTVLVISGLYVFGWAHALGNSLLRCLIYTDG